MCSENICGLKQYKDEVIYNCLLLQIAKNPRHLFFNFFSCHFNVSTSDSGVINQISDNPENHLNNAEDTDTCK